MDAAKQPPLILEIHNWGIRVAEELDEKAQAGLPLAQLFMESIIAEARRCIPGNEMIEAEYDDGAQVLEVYTVRRVADSIQKLFKYLFTNTGISVRDMRPQEVLNLDRWDKWMKPQQRYPPVWRKGRIASDDIAVQLDIPGHKQDTQYTYAPPPRSGWSGQEYDLDEAAEEIRRQARAAGPNPFTSHFGGFGGFGRTRDPRMDPLYDLFNRYEQAKRQKEQEQRQQAPPPPRGPSVDRSVMDACLALDLPFEINKPVSFTADQLSKAYRKKAMQYHPDLNPGDKQAETKMKEVNAANDLLKRRLNL